MLWKDANQESETLKHVRKSTCINLYPILVARSEPMPQQKPLKKRDRGEKVPMAAFEAFEASESQTKPMETSLAEAISMAQSLPIHVHNADDSKEGNCENENDCKRRRRGDLPPGRSESPSPFRCRPAGYRQKRRAVASAVAMAIHGLKMAKQRQAERITLVAWKGWGFYDVSNLFLIEDWHFDPQYTYVIYYTE